MTTKYFLTNDFISLLILINLNIFLNIYFCPVIFIPRPVVLLNIALFLLFLPQQTTWTTSHQTAESLKIHKVNLTITHRQQYLNSILFSYLVFFHVSWITVNERAILFPNVGFINFKKPMFDSYLDMFTITDISFGLISQCV